MSHLSEEEKQGKGCAILLGLITVSIAIGFLTQQAYGWLTFGGLLLLIALL